MGFLFDNGADSFLEKAAFEFEKVKVPTIEDQKIQLEKYVKSGDLTPEQAQVFLQDPSAMNEISLDPALKQAQYDALNSLQEIGNEGGLTAMDKAKLAQIQTEENTAARGQRQAILQNAQERGVGGSGLEMLSQMQNQQDSATRASQRGLDVAALAQERALQALQQAGQLGGQMQAQDFSQKADVARQNDAINQFNAQNKTQVGMANTNTTNDAKKYNHVNTQDIANKNVDLTNSQTTYNKGLQQTEFENKMAIAGGKAGAYGSQAEQRMSDSANKQKLLGTGIAAAGMLAMSDENLKEDIKEFDASDFLDSITGYKYKYKDSKHGKGPQVGVMAQDIEKELPMLVKETPEGKAIDFSKAGGPVFAVMADINDRLKKLEGK